MSDSNGIDINKITKWNPYIPISPFSNQLLFLRSREQEILYGGAARGGKMSPVDTQVVTPFGLRKLGDLKVGDKISTPDGSAATIIQIHEHGEKDVYKVTFVDGRILEVGLEHLWKIKKTRTNRRKSNKNGEGGWFIADTEWMINYINKNGNYNLAVPLTEPVIFTKSYKVKMRKIDPYLLGVLIGDGCITDPCGLISISGKDCEIFDEIEKLGYSLKRYEKQAKILQCTELKTELNRLKLLGKYSYNKFIPECYKYSSVEDRISLIQGLMDTDGYVDDRGHLSYTTTSERLAKDVQWVIRSLGGRASITEKIPTYTYEEIKKEGRKAYTVWIQIKDKDRLVRLTRKKERCKDKKYIGGFQEPSLTIEKIEYSRKAVCRCITISHTDGLYLAEDFVVTHNSVSLLAAALQYVDVPGYHALIIRRNFSELNLAGALIPMSKEWLSNTDARWDMKNNTWHFPSGASLTFGYLEHKDDIYRYLGCFTPQTEILTEDGWKGIADVKKGEIVATMNPETREMGYRPVSETMEYDYIGPMYRMYQRQGVSYDVTPNHKIWTSSYNKTYRKNNNSLISKEAKDVALTDAIPQTCVYNLGETKNEYIFASDGHNGRTIKFTSGDFADFIGWYVSEGYTDTSRWSINITQMKEPGKTMIRELLDRIGVNYSYYIKKYSFNNKALCQYLRNETGLHAHEKQIPKECMKWDKKHLQILLDSLVCGDGTWRDAEHKYGHYVTSSDKLKDDVCEIGIKCGYRVTTCLREGSPFNGYKSRPQWHISLFRKTQDTVLNKKADVYDYDGKVYCVTVPPYHSVLIRHNGRISWSGQSEYQFIGFDELTEHPIDNYLFLFSRLVRTKKMEEQGIPLRMRATTNPGGEYGEWVYERFIDKNTRQKYRQIAIEDIMIERGCTADEISEEDIRYRIPRFIPSKVVDNPHVDVKTYLASLSKLDPVKKAQYLEGDWEIRAMGNMFNRSWIEIVRPSAVPLNDLRCARYWDLAATVKSSSDYTATAKIGYDRTTGLFYILDVEMMKGAPHEIESRVLAYLNQDGPHCYIYMEQEPGSSGLVSIDNYKRKVIPPGYMFYPDRVTGSKEDRARPLSAAMGNGLIKIVDFPKRKLWYNDVMNQLEVFPAGDHDDGVDALSGCFNSLTKMIRSSAAYIGKLETIEPVVRDNEYLPEYAQPAKGRNIVDMITNGNPNDIFVRRP